MTVGRVTQGMMSRQSLAGMQTSLGRLSQIQEQLSTGRIINRPSDDPAGAASAMRLRQSITAQQQYSRNAADGQGWLDQADTTLGSMTDQVRSARELGLEGANTGAMGAQAREALATEVDGILEGLVASANTTYLGRPIFGGITSGSAAYTTDPADGKVKYIGVDGAVERTVADGVTIRVDVPGPSVFGKTGDTPGVSLFDHMTAMSAALRSGDSAQLQAAISALGTDGERIVNTRSNVGTQTARIEQAQVSADDAELTLTNALSEIENTDLPKATVELKLQEVAYQAALGATARVMQPSLLDFLR